MGGEGQMGAGAVGRKGWGVRRSRTIRGRTQTRNFDEFSAEEYLKTTLEH